MLSQDVVRRLTVIASDTGLTTLKTKLDAVDNAQDRVAISSTRMGRATEEAERRIQTLVRQGSSLATGAVGGVAGRAGMDALALAGRIAPVALAGYAAFKLLNATVAQGVDLLEKYGIAGQRSMFGEGVDDALTKLTRFQNDKASLEQINRATELSDRLDIAKRTIGDFLKLQLDLTDPALRLQSIWVAINETIAKAANAASRLSLPDLPDFPTARKYLGPGLQFGARVGEGLIRATPGVGQAYDLAQSTAGAQPEATAEQALTLARNRLAAGMGGGFVGRFNQAILDIKDPPKADAEKEKNTASEYDRLEKSLERQSAAMEAESKAVGASIGEHARLRTEMRLQEAAMQDIAKNGGSMSDYEDRIKKISDRLGEATQKAAELKLKSDLGFERSQIGRDPIEAGIASRLRPIYGDDYINQMDSATAQAIRFNEQLRQSKELLTDFATGFAGDFRSQLRDGVDAWQAFGNAGLNALTRLSDKLTDMALSNLVARAFGGSSGGGLASLFGGGNGVQFGLSPGDSGFVGPVQTGRVGGMIGSLPSAGYIHAAYFDDAPHMRGGGRITDDGVPIIAHPGERILNRQEAASYGKPAVIQQRVVVHNYGADVQQNTNNDGDLELTVRAVARDEMASGRTNSINRQKYGQSPRIKMRS